ncbi:hypothetical protein AB0E62_32860 [Streptomyces sp. NPDC038707]|uniref:hypothetical protein n=1 Tax=Streptomyces sp. NPDC038707 TaxID=3154329 RepID=UPI0033CFB93D
MLTQLIPAVLGFTWLVALGSNRAAPCDPPRPAKRPPSEHLRAMANHARVIAVLIAKRTGANGI